MLALHIFLLAQNNHCAYLISYNFKEIMRVCVLIIYLLRHLPVDAVGAI